MDTEYEVQDPWSLDAVVERPAPKAFRAVFYGTHGVGKTTLFSNFPGHVLARVEDGEGSINVRHFPKRVESYYDACQAIGAILRDPSRYQYLGFDTLDWLEPLIWAETCSREKIESVESLGYGKGYILVDKVWQEFIDGLNAVRDAGVNVIILAHHEVTQYSPPESEPYNRYDLAIHKRARALFHEWADIVGFCYDKTTVLTRTEKVSKTQEKLHVRAGGDGGKWVGLKRTPTYEAKNRYGMPNEIPLTKDATTANQILQLVANSYTAQEP